MSRSSICIFTLLIFISTTSLAASDSTANFAKPLSKASIAKKKRKPSGKFLRVGIGFMHWNEPMTLIQGNQSTSGVANYAGACLTFEFTRQNFGLYTRLGAGKASSGSFGSNLEFADGTNRTWFGIDSGPFWFFWINRQFSLGGGALAKIRFVDWEPADKTLTVKTKKNLEFGPEILMKLLVSPRFSVHQSFAYLGPSESQWSMSLSYRF
jgi:hypothetical protein